MEHLQQRRNDVVSAEICESLYRPVAYVHIVIVDRRQQDLCGALRLYAAIAEQPNVPERIRTRSLRPGASLGFEPIDRRRALLQVARCNIDLDRGGTHPEIV